MQWRFGRRGIVAPAVGLVVAAWFVWPAAGAPRRDTVIIGDGTVQQSSDELARRFRQEGSAADVEVVAALACADVAALGRGYRRVVVSFTNWSACGAWPGNVGLLVEQPLGGEAVGDAARGVRVRHASDLFIGTGNESCAWWDTPGAGEDRPGLGQCGPDGLVAVSDAATLTDAGRERFARLVVESAK